MNNSKLKNRQSSIVNRQSPRAFTLVELMIVVSILGILAAIALPEFQNHQQKAKEAQAKANLRTLREAIERYYATHGVAPGYNNNDSSTTPNYLFVYSQLAVNKTYLSEIPKNPFNGKRGMRVLENNATLDEAAFKLYPPEMYGWIYHPATRTIKLHWHGVDTDSEDKKFFDY